MKKILIFVIIGVTIIFIVTFYFLGNKFYMFAMDRQKVGIRIFLPESEQTISEQDWKQYQITEVTMASHDNLKLHAYEMKQGSSNKWAILIHGYTGTAISMISQGKQFYERGYNILMIDLRAHGKSEGQNIAMGWIDRYDVLKWIDYIVTKDQNSQIILYGISMGGATVMMTSGESLPPNVIAGIEDCGYTSVWDEFAYQLADMFHLPKFPFLYATSQVAQYKQGFNLKQASSIKQLKKRKIPMLFIHGDQDQVVPFSMVDDLYNASDFEKQKYIVKDAGHGEAEQKNPKLYWQTIDQFLTTYIS